MPTLFSPIHIKGKKIKNRIVMPPMVCFNWAGENGMVSEKNIKHYEARAKGGTGLIIVEATCVNKDGRLHESQLGIWSDEQIEGLRKIASRCHEYGAVVLVQIHHAGFKTPRSVSSVALAPSDYQGNGRTARKMTLDELHRISQDFVDAAVRVEQAGFDGVELHGAHGFLLDQFMSPLVNRRDDQYGGSLENRARFALEIIDGIKSRTAKDFIIGYRMGGNEPTLDAGIQIAQILEKGGVDLLHVSTGISSDHLPTVPSGFPYNWIVYCGTEIKKHVSIPVIVVNDIRTPKRAAYLVENGLADLVAIGKGHLTDPEWAIKAMEGKEPIPCLKCAHCQWFTDGEKCPQNRKRLQLEVERQ